ncbi:MAG: serine/threonine-protein kinase [Isosphaeraceae bacterium]
MSPGDPGCTHPAPEPAAEGELLRILEGYQAEAEAGRPVDTAEAIAAHPELADELCTCLRVMRLADRMARRLQGGAEVSASSGRLRRVQDALGQLSDVAREAVGRTRTGLTTELSAALSDSLATSWPTANLEANLPETEAASVTGRYRLLARIGRGGMGVVYRARDDVLDRELAVKVIRDDCRGDPRCLHRFLEEARIAGRLQHPGVVPVYDVGHLGDLRPFFAMKLVEGRTLAELLVQRSSPSEELSRLLAIFEAVCRTMAYAHASGVVHRDLKPANVMVGPFGEVQVMDWGLAKVVGRDGGDAPSLDDSPAPDEVGARLGACETPATQPGSVLDTPLYMAPEQARGQTDHVDERADVFGLGAIFCEVLTGRPPFTGATPAEIRRKAADANLAEALAVLDGCGADAELVRLARRCLAAEPEGRPHNAAAVAEAVTAYQDGVQERLRAVERKRVQAEATAASAQKRCRVQVSLAASLSGLFLVVVIGWLAFERIERNRRIVLRGEVNSAINEANRLEGEARSGSDLALWDRAVEAARRAESLDRSGGGRSGLGGQVTRLLTRLRDAQQQAHVRAEIEARDRTMVAALEQARFEGMELTAGLSSDYRGPVSAYRTAFKTYGIDIDGLPESELSARLNASAIRGELAAAPGDWAFRVSSSAEKSRLLRLTHTIDPDPLRDVVRNAVAQNDVAALKALAQRKDLALLPAVTIEILGVALSDLGAAHEALAVLRVGQQQYPGNLWLNHDLALLLSHVWCPLT